MRRHAGRSALVALALAAAVTMPTLAADPSTKPAKASKEPATPITLSGTIGATTGENGRTSYSLSSGGTTYELSAGPWWWFGTNHPLAGLVGSSVTIVGSRRGDSLDVSVETVDGRALREPGKPPWAGGPKAVGERHPGFKAWKSAREAWKSSRMARLGADGRPGLGKAGAPGQLKPRPSEAPEG